MKFVTTPTAVAVHAEDDNPVFGETATHIRVNDEGDGPFLVITQFRESLGPGEIWLCIEEIDAVAVAARSLIAAQPDEVTPNAKG